MSLLHGLVLIVHCLQESKTVNRIDALCLRQCPLTPSFELICRGESITCLARSNCLNVVPYFIRLLECSCVSEKATDPGALDLPQSFFLGALSQFFVVVVSLRSLSFAEQPIGIARSSPLCIGFQRSGSLRLQSPSEKYAERRIRG